MQEKRCGAGAQQEGPPTGPLRIAALQASDRRWLCEQPLLITPLLTTWAHRCPPLRKSGGAGGKHGGEENAGVIQGESPVRVSSAGF